MLSLNYQERDSVLLGARPLGQIGIVTATGGGYSQFLGGPAPDSASGGLRRPGLGSHRWMTTTLPTRVFIAGGPGLGQFREDGTLGTHCSVFNFNPYNYYQTPLERYNATMLASLDVGENAEVYSMFNYGKSIVDQQIAPSGVFGTPLFTPLANPLIGAQARQAMIDAANAGVLAGTVNLAGVPNTSTPNPERLPDSQLERPQRERRSRRGRRSQHRLPQANGRVRAALGELQQRAFQAMLGFRGDFTENWSYDASFQYGETNRILVRRGYTNLTNIGNALRTTNGTTCLTAMRPAFRSTCSAASARSRRRWRPTPPRRLFRSRTTSS